MTGASSASSRLAIGLLLLSALAVGAVAGEHGEEDHGALLEQGEPGVDGWAVWELTVEQEGTDVYLWRMAEQMKAPYHVGVALYTAEGELETWGTLQGWRGEGVTVRSSAGPGVDPWQAGSYGDFGAHTYVRDLEAGEHVFAAWWAAGEGDWSYALHGDGVELEATSAGEEAFVHTTRSFQAPLNAQLWMGGATSTHAVVDGRLGLEVHDTLLFYGSSRALHADYTLHTPQGAEHACPCTFLEATGPDRLGQGAYELTATSASVGEIIAGGADVRFPFDPPS